MTDCRPEDDVWYRYRLMYAQCQEFDDVTQTWSPGNCEILPGTTARRAKFKSNLLESIGAGVFVGPNTIDFDEVFDDLGSKIVEVKIHNDFPVVFITRNSRYK